MKRYLTLTFVIMLGCFVTFSNGYAENLSVGFSGAEMRSKPSAMNSKVIAKLALYSPVTIIEQGAEYYKVKDYRGRSGWVHRSLLNKAQGAVVTGGSANVRQGPGTSHPVSFQVSKGSAVKVLEKQENWVLIQTAENKQGWIADFLIWGE